MLQVSGEEGLLVVDEDGAVLEQGMLGPPLRAADELPSARHQLAARRMIEAGNRTGLHRLDSRDRHGDVDAERPQRVHEKTIDQDI